MKLGEGWTAVMKSRGHLEGSSALLLPKMASYRRTACMALSLFCWKHCLCSDDQKADFHFLVAHYIPGTIRNTSNPYNTVK